MTNLAKKMDISCCFCIFTVYAAVLLHVGICVSKAAADCQLSNISRVP